MNDTEFPRLWRTLEPSGRRRARIENRVFEWIEARQTSLASEWLRLIRIDPVPGLALAAAAALSLLFLTPFGWLAYAAL
jgi:hypothetical protein